MSEDSIYTKAVHAGDDPESNLGSLVVPVYQSAVFTFPDAEQGAAIHEGEQPGYFYGRMGNPTQAALEKALCELEGGSAAMAFSSGMAAISTTLFTLVRKLICIGLLTGLLKSLKNSRWITRFLTAASRMPLRPVRKLVSTHG